MGNALFISARAVSTYGRAEPGVLSPALVPFEEDPAPPALTVFAKLTSRKEKVTFMPGTLSSEESCLRSDAIVVEF
jgi:hypothetical protein